MDLEKSIQNCVLSEQLLEQVPAWREIMAKAESSGMPLTRWCKANGVSHSLFHRWRARLRKLDAASAAVAAAFPPENDRPNNDSAPAFVGLLQILPPPADCARTEAPGDTAQKCRNTKEFRPAFMVQIGQDTLFVSNGADASTFAELLKALKQA